MMTEFTDRDIAVMRGRLAPARPAKLNDAMERLQRGMAEHAPAAMTIFRNSQGDWSVELAITDVGVHFAERNDLADTMAEVLDEVGWR